MARVILGVLLMFSLAACNATNPSSILLNDAPQSAGTTYWWNDTVFYEIFVRSFYDSDGDGIGDLQGIIQKLDYLNDGNPETSSDLGITGIWLMPVSQSPSYHGYDVTDYYTIEDDYGNNDDFLALMDACHARGIKVIVDLVMNHCSSQHPWFIASQQNDPEYTDWFRWSSTDPGYLGPWGQPVWHQGTNGLYYYGIFWGGMPDLNYAHSPVNTPCERLPRTGCRICTPMDFVVMQQSIFLKRVNSSLMYRQPSTGGKNFMIFIPV